MTGYSIETRRRVAHSPKWKALAPALTQAQIAALAPTIIVKTPRVADESRLRHDDPTLFDLARLTWHERDQRQRTEDLRAPLPGSNLVVAGECSMPWMQYVRAVASNQTPGPLRVHTKHLSVAHTIAPHEDHVMVPLGWESMSYRDIKALFVGHRHKRFWHADCDHEVSVHAVDGDTDGKYQWRCRRCEEYGFEDYTQETLGRATGVVWHGCTICLASDFRPDHSRALFESWGAFGVAAKVGYREWATPITRRDAMGIMALGVAALIAIPFVPPAYGAPNTIFVNYNAGSLNSGTGTTGSPYGSLERARSSGSVVAGNGDTIKLRDTGGNYLERFDSAHLFPAGTSFALPTTITKDTGHTPLFRPATGDNIFRSIGSSQQYIIWDSITFDCTSISGAAIVANASSVNATSASVAAHHMRMTGINAYNLNADTGYISFGSAHHNEILSCTLHDTTGVGAGAGVHACYINGLDNLVQAVEAYVVTGYLFHGYDSGLGGDCASTRGVGRRSRTKGTGRGVILTTGSSQLLYHLVIYDCTLGVGAGYINGSTSAKLLNWTATANFSGGITITAASTSTYLRNNISDGNGGSGNFVNSAGSTNHSTGNTNSWNSGWTTTGFVSFSTRDLHLGASSSGISHGTSIASDINAGTFAESSVVDFDGVSVPQDGTPDTGAFEFISASSPPSEPFTGDDNVAPYRGGRLRRRHEK